MRCHFLVKEDYMAGKFFAANLTSTAGGDLITALKSAGGFESMNVTKVTIIGDAALSIKINEQGDVYSPLYEDTSDSKWKVSLSYNDVFATSIKAEQAGVNIWIAVSF